MLKCMLPRRPRTRRADSNMAASGESKAAAKNVKGKGMSQEQIIAGFQEMRQQLRAIASKISELEMERKEHE